MFTQIEARSINILNLTYAQKNEKLVHVSEVERGLKCGCVCPACGEVLIARKGNKVVHHFAHKSTIECQYGYQTSLHMVAKKIISEYKMIKVPELGLHFPKTNKKELIEEERVLNVSEVVLEKKVNDIIPDILLLTDIGQIIVEIYVTHEVDSEKKKKIKRIGIPVIEINLSEFERNICEEDLREILIDKNDFKTWIYNGKREETYKKFLQVSEVKEIVVRNYAFHVDNCPIKKRVWKQKSYANFHNDCLYCDYHIGMTKDGGILCSGRERVAHLCDFSIPKENRINSSNEKREEEIYDSVGLRVCPQCGHSLVIRNGKYGEFFGCSNFPHCRFTFNYGN